jgi:hypothetical protein
MVSIVMWYQVQLTWAMRLQYDNPPSSTDTQVSDYSASPWCEYVLQLSAVIAHYRDLQASR